MHGAVLLGGGVLAVVGLLVVFGGVTGRLAAMIAALADPTQLTAPSSGGGGILGGGSTLSKVVTGLGLSNPITAPIIIGKKLAGEISPGHKLVKPGPGRPPEVAPPP